MTTQGRANIVDANEVAGRLQLARVNLGTLLENNEARSDVEQAATQAIRGQLDSKRPPAVPPAVLKKLDSATAAVLSKGGVKALSAPQKDALATLIVEAKLQELRSYADGNGYIEGARAGQVFRWLDYWDSNGSGRDFDLFTPESTTTAKLQLTPTGRIFKRVLESTESDVQFTDEEFVAGFMNGKFNPERFRNLPKEKADLLRNVGVYDLLATRLATSQIPQDLSEDTLTTMFRRIDAKVDKDLKGRTMTARGPGVAGQRETPFPLQPRTSPEGKTNGTYNVMRVLRDLFDVRDAHSPTQGEVAPNDLVPPPANDLTENPLRNRRDEPLAKRTAIDRETFSNYMRDARLNLADIEKDDAAWRHLEDAFKAAGVSIDELRRLATSNVIGGSADRDASGVAMQRLHALLASPRFGGARGTINPWTKGPNGARSPAGRVLEVLDLHLERFNLKTREDLARDLGTGRIKLAGLDAKLDKTVVTGNGPRTVRDLLTEAGVNIDQLKEAGRTSDGLANYLFTFASQTGHTEKGMRPHTVSLGRVNKGEYFETDAGRVVGLIDRYLLQGYGQQFRAYTNRNPGPMEALVEHNGVPVAQIPTTFYGWNENDPFGCFGKTGATINSSGVVTVLPLSATNHYIAHGADNVLGAIRGEDEDLQAGYDYVDGMMSLKLPVMVAVMRRGPPGGAAGNPGSGVRHTVSIDKRGFDPTPQGPRKWFEGWDSGSITPRRVRLYVDPRTKLLYAPADPSNPIPIAKGGYQVSMFKVPIWVKTAKQLPGTRPSRNPKGGFDVYDQQLFFMHFTGGVPMRGPMTSPPVQARAAAPKPAQPVAKRG